MNVHLLRSSEVSELFIEQVYSILSSFTGPVNYIPEDKKLRWQDIELEELDWEDEEYFKKKQVEYHVSDLLMSPEREFVVKWDDIFSKTSEYRKNNSIPDDEYIVILTDHANEHNWFSAGAPSGAMDFFVHTGMWENFLDCDPRFPVVYQVNSLPLKMAMYDSYSRLAENAHRDARGCINDLCMDKREIVMKMRTGDICQDCVERIVSRKVDPALVSQTLQVMDSVRSHMLFRERYKITRQPSRLEIRGNNLRFYLPDLGNIKVPLSPMERAVYLLILNHPEGIPVSHFPDFLDELKRYYSKTSVEGSVATIRERVVAITENQDSLLSQIISRIKSKFIDLVGQDLAEAYIIKGERGEARRIGLDRGLLLIKNDMD